MPTGPKTYYLVRLKYFKGDHKWPRYIDLSGSSIKDALERAISWSREFSIKNITIESMQKVYDPEDVSVEEVKALGLGELVTVIESR